jgi:hypothetical protein
MNDIVTAAKNNDLDSLRHLIDLEKVRDPDYDPKTMPYTQAMNRASITAARHDHPAALGILLDSGCWINDGKLIVSTISM